MDNNENKKWLRIILAIIGVGIGIFMLVSAWKGASKKGTYDAGYRDSYKSVYQKK